MAASFAGFPEEAMTFFRGLARHNNREWFLPRKAAFDEHVKSPMRALVEAVNEGMAKFAPDYITDPDKAIYRFYRDTRFSADKSPYKDHTAASFSRRGLARHVGAGYYFQVSHRDVGIGGGIYIAPPETVAAVRARIAERHDEFRKIVTARGLVRLLGEMQGERLARTPKGYPCDHPAADLLRYKQFLFYTELPAEVALGPRVYTEIMSRFRAMAPFMEFLNAALTVKRSSPSPRAAFF